MMEELLLLEDFQLLFRLMEKYEEKKNVSIDTEQAELEALAMRNENVKKILANQPIKKVIYVKEKLINFRLK